MAPNVRSEIDSLQPDIVSWRRQLHRIPELGFEEIETARFISARLSEWEIEHKTAIAETGIIATIRGDDPGPTVAIRADMDALPIAEENQIPYRSERAGRMHACGHDGHVAILLGVARYFSAHRERIRGVVRLIFQPAEEGLGGAEPMIRGGALRDPAAGIAVGLHLWNPLPSGTVAAGDGAVMGAVELFELRIIGSGGHGAMPHQTIDALVVAARVVDALQTIVSRNVDPFSPAVVSVGELHAGDANNVIAGSAVLRGTVRYLDTSLEGYFGPRIEEIVAGVCRSHGARYELDYHAHFPPLINDAEVSALVRDVAGEVLETPGTVTSTQQTLAGEDFALYTREVPGCFFFLGSGGDQPDSAFPHHHPRFNIDETVLSLGVEIFVRIVERYGETGGRRSR